MEINYTALIFLKDEPYRVHPLIENLKGHARILVLLAEDDKLTEPFLVENSIPYLRRPSNYSKMSWSKKAEWVLNQSKTDYVFICYASFFVSIELLKVFQETSRDRIHDAVYHSNIYWSYGTVVQQPTFFRKSNSCYFFNKNVIDYGNVSVHDEFPINKKAVILRLVPKKSLCLNIFRDDDMIIVNQKHTAYAEVEATEKIGKIKNIKFSTILYKVFRAFVVNYIKMGGFRSGVPGLIYHSHYAIYQFLVYSRIWELQNKCDYINNRNRHQKIKLDLISINSKNNDVIQS